jgi:hypothetical protein
MKRKHMPGNCYCCECTPVDVDELPIAQISGYTFVSWGGSECCKCALYLKDEIEWTEECSDVFASLETQTEYEWQETALLNPKPKRFFSLGGGVPELDEYCCYGEPFAVANHEYSDVRTLRYKAIFRRSPFAIRICFSRQSVTCEGEEPQLKWVVHAQYQVTYELVYSQGGSRDIDHTVTKLAGDCFELIPEGEIGNRCDSCDDSVDPACTFEEYEQSSPPCGGASGIVNFDRIKFFDELPEGQYLFSDEDNLQGCSFEFCQESFNFESELCLTVSSYPNCFPYCFCSTTSNAYVDDFEFINFTGQCFCNECEALPLASGDGVSFAFFLGENCDLVSTFCYGCTEDTNPADGHQDCGYWTMSKYTTGCEGNVSVPPFTYDTDCPQWLEHSTPFIPGPCDSYSATPLFPGDAIDACVNGTQVKFRELSGCYQVVSCDDCDADCCYQDVCPGSQEIICGGPKYSMYASNVTFTDWSVSCELTPVEFCITFPGLSVTFEF